MTEQRPNPITTLTESLKAAAPRPANSAKKIAYTAAGTFLVALAVILQRLDGGGADLALLIVLGIVLLIASAEPTPRRAVKP